MVAGRITRLRWAFCFPGTKYQQVTLPPSSILHGVPTLHARPFPPDNSPGETQPSRHLIATPNPKLLRVVFRWRMLNVLAIRKPSVQFDLFSDSIFASMGRASDISVAIWPSGYPGSLSVEGRGEQSEQSASSALRRSLHISTASARHSEGCAVLRSRALTARVSLNISASKRGV